MTISSWLNFDRSAPPGRGSAAGQKFLLPPARSVCVSLSAFSLASRRICQTKSNRFDVRNVISIRSDSQMISPGEKTAGPTCCLAKTASYPTAKSRFAHGPVVRPAALFGPSFSNPAVSAVPVRRRSVVASVGRYWRYHDISRYQISRYQYRRGDDTFAILTNWNKKVIQICWAESTACRRREMDTKYSVVSISKD